MPSTTFGFLLPIRVSHTPSCTLIGHWAAKHVWAQALLSVAKRFLNSASSLFESITTETESIYYTTSYARFVLSPWRRKSALLPSASSVSPCVGELGLPTWFIILLCSELILESGASSRSDTLPHYPSATSADHRVCRRNRRKPVIWDFRRNAVLVSILRISQGASVAPTDFTPRL